MNNTTNFSFKKPELTDAADITNINENWDKLDTILEHTFGALSCEVVYDANFMDEIDELIRANVGSTIGVLINNEDGSRAGMAIVHCLADEYATIEFLTVDNSGLLVKLTLNKRSGVWDNEWSYVNPPLGFGTEYRTTEFFGGKPVYTKVVSFGTLPNATKLEKAHSCSIDNIIRINGTMSSGTILPHYYDNTDYVTLSADAENIYIYASKNYSYTSAYVQLWYTKP